MNEKLLKLFEENEQLFNETIEELDSWNGYLNDNRYYSMDELSEVLYGKDPIDILNMAYFGRDDECYHTDAHGNKEYGSFNPNRDYFYFNGYGNLVSADYKDYSHLLDNYFIESLIDNYESLYLDDEILEIIEGAKEDDNE